MKIVVPFHFLDEEVPRDQIVPMIVGTRERAVANGDENEFYKAVREREAFLRRHHYWKMQLVRYYQQMADRIGLILDYCHEKISNNID